MSHTDSSALAAYNSLMDPHLGGYFGNLRMRKHLKQSGLITKSGEIVSENTYRLNMARKEHKKHVRDLLAQAIVHKTLDMERSRQVVIRKKLEEIAKMELVRRVRGEPSYWSEMITDLPRSALRRKDRRNNATQTPDDCPHCQALCSDTEETERSRKGDEEILPYLSPRPKSAKGARPASGRPASGRPKSAPSKGRNRSTSPADDKIVILDDDGMPLSPRSGSSSGSTGSTSRGRSPPKKSKYPRGELDDRHLYSLNQQTLREYTMARYNVEHGQGPSPYLMAQMPSPPQSGRPKSAQRNTARNRRTVTATDSKGRPLKPRNNKGSLVLHRREPAMRHQDKPHSNVEVTIHYFGSNLKLECEKFDPRDDVLIEQQHCGGNTLIVYREKVMPGSCFEFTSRRHRGFPFGLTFYVNGLEDCRLSACCEYKHRLGSKLGGKHGHFGIRSIKGAAACYKCQVSEEMRGNESKPRRKTQKPRKEEKGDVEVSVDEKDQPDSKTQRETTRSEYEVRGEGEVTERQHNDSVEVPVEDQEDKDTKEDESYADDFDDDDDQKKGESTDYSSRSRSRSSSRSSNSSSSSSRSHSRSKSSYTSGGRSRSSSSSSRSSSSSDTERSKQTKSPSPVQTLESKENQVTSPTARSPEPVMPIGLGKPAEVRNMSSSDSDGDMPVPRHERSMSYHSSDDDMYATPDENESPRQQKESPRQDTGSPKQKAESPRQNTGSPRQKEESLKQKQESPRQKGESPRQKEESPRQKTESPRQQKESPRQDTEKPVVLSQASTSRDDSDSSTTYTYTDSSSDSSAASTPRPVSPKQQPQPDRASVGETEGEREGVSAIVVSTIEEKTDKPTTESLDKATTDSETDDRESTASTHSVQSKQDSIIDMIPDEALYQGKYEYDPLPEAALYDRKEKSAEKAEDQGAGLSAFAPVLVQKARSQVSSDESSDSSSDSDSESEEVSHTDQSQPSKPDKSSSPSGGVMSAEKETSIRSLVEGRSDLELTGKELKETQIDELCDCIKTNGTVHSLTLRNSGVDDVSVGKLSRVLVDTAPSTDLRLLNVNCNNITAAGVPPILCIVTAKTDMKILLMHGNPLGNSGVAELIRGLVQTHQFRQSDEERLSKEELQSIRATAQDLVSDVMKEVLHTSTTSTDSQASHTQVSGGLPLTQLDIGDCGMTEKGATSVADLISANTNIRTLGLTGNKNIGITGWLAIADALRNNTHILSLSLDYNELGDAGAAILAEALRENSSIKELDLEGNKIGEEGASRLLEMLEENKTLQDITLFRGNNISDETLEKINRALKK